MVLATMSDIPNCKIVLGGKHVTGGGTRYEDEGRYSRCVGRSGSFGRGDIMHDQHPMVSVVESRRAFHRSGRNSFYQEEANPRGAGIPEDIQGGDVKRIAQF